MRLNLNLDIKRIHQWYRHSTKEWLIDVVYTTDETSGVICYSNKKLNNAKKIMFKNIMKDIIKDEFKKEIRMLSIEK